MKPVIIEHVEVYGFRAAFRGMRNATETWDKSDSTFWLSDHLTKPEDFRWPVRYLVPEIPNLGPEDLRVSKKLVKTSGSERKFMRMIWVWADLTIPLNVWNELDTYKIATTRNSTSTMNKLGRRPLVLEDFADGGTVEGEIDLDDLVKINALGEKLRAASGKERVALLRRIRRRLPWGFMQKATYNFNYETALHIWFDRRNHRLPEWSEEDGLCAFIESLPYMEDFIEACNSKGVTP